MYFEGDFWQEIKMKISAKNRRYFGFILIRIELFGEIIKLKADNFNNKSIAGNIHLKSTKQLDAGFQLFY